MPKTALFVKGLKVRYGAIEAIKGIDMEVFEGDVVAILGANGAGKTSTLRTLSGLIEPAEGSILFYNQEIGNMEPEKIAALGIAQSPEGRQVFRDLTVEENLKVGAFTVKDKKRIAEQFEKVYRYFPVLKERKQQIASTLSGGEQQMLAISRALMAKPKLLLLDEPSMGLAPLLVKEIFNIIRDINATGTTIFLVEQNAMQALRIADKAYVLETGTIVLQGTGQELLSSPEVQKVYLGG